MKLNDLAGEVRISSEDAINFVQAWFKPDDKICISGLKAERTGGLDAVAQSMTAREFIDTTNDEALDSLIFDEDGGRWNIYVSVSPIKDDVALRSRGTKSNVEYIPGVWADIDVQDGGFESQESILEWLDTLELEPTIIASSGSSGLHVYWRLRWDEQGDEKLVDAWWSYLDEMAGDRSIDKLVDSTRILRLPGTVRFPKKDERKSNKIGAVQLLKVNDVRYSVARIRGVSADALAKKALVRKKTIQRDAERRMEVDEFARSLLSADSGNRWGLLQAVSTMEDYVNDNWDWAHILEPFGWKFRRTLYDGSKEWARPGQNDRSAVVDYADSYTGVISPVMSLLSMSESTGLADLKDAGIPLTKYRVALRLHYDDDEQAMIQDLIEQQREQLQQESN